MKEAALGALVHNEASSNALAILEMFLSFLSFLIYCVYARISTKKKEYF